MPDFFDLFIVNRQHYTCYFHHCTVIMTVFGIRKYKSVKSLGIFKKSVIRSYVEAVDEEVTVFTYGL